MSTRNHTLSEASAASYQTVARTLHKVKKEREPGAELRLTLDKLHGNLLSASDLRDLLLYSLVGGTGSSKPNWCYFRPWKRTTQSVLVRVDCGEDLVGRFDYSSDVLNIAFRNGLRCLYTSTKKALL